MASAAALAGVRPWDPASADAATARSPLLRSSYTSLRDTRFNVDGVTLKLLSVSDLPAARTVPALRGSEQSFSLVFSGPLSVTLASGVHSFRNLELGAFKLFISPVADPDSDQLYEVVVISRPPAKRRRPPRPQRRPRRRRAPGVRGVVRGIRVRRAGRGLALKLRLSGKSHVKVVTVWLMRGDRLVAAGMAKRVGGRRRVALKLTPRRRLRGGRYVLYVQTRDRRGRESYRRQRLKLR